MNLSNNQPTEFTVSRNIALSKVNNKLETLMSALSCNLDFETISDLKAELQDVENEKALIESDSETFNQQ